MESFHFYLEQDKYGWTPIHGAARNGHTEIVKILAPLMDNPNAPNNVGDTPILMAKNTEIRSILESFKTSTINKTIHEK